MPEQTAQRRETKITCKTKARTDVTKSFEFGTDVSLTFLASLVNRELAFFVADLLDSGYFFLAMTNDTPTDCDEGGYFVALCHRDEELRWYDVEYAEASVGVPQACVELSRRFAIRWTRGFEIRPMQSWLN